MTNILKQAEIVVKKKENAKINTQKMFKKVWLKELRYI